MSRESRRWTVYLLIIGSCAAIAYTFGFYQGADSSAFSAKSAAAIQQETNHELNQHSAAENQQATADPKSTPTLEVRTYYVGDIILSEPWQAKQPGISGGITLQDFQPLLEDLQETLGHVDQLVSFQPYISSLSLVLSAAENQHDLVQDRLVKIRLDSKLPLNPKPLAFSQ